MSIQPKYPMTGRTAAAMLNATQQLTDLSSPAAVIKALFGTLTWKERHRRPFYKHEVDDRFYTMVLAGELANGEIELSPEQRDKLAHETKLYLSISARLSLDPLDVCCDWILSAAERSLLTTT